jgi:hypothetical protein
MLVQTSVIESLVRVTKWQIALKIQMNSCVYLCFFLAAYKLFQLIWR